MTAWVRAGFRPRNPALTSFLDATHAFSSDSTGTDAGANPMAGTVGAMAYLQQTTPTNFLLYQQTEY